jgi:hypothetical protein
MPQHKVNNHNKRKSDAEGLISSVNFERYITVEKIPNSNLRDSKRKRKRRKKQKERI